MKSYKSLGVTERAQWVRHLLLDSGPRFHPRIPMTEKAYSYRFSSVLHTHAMAWPRMHAHRHARTHM